MSKSVGNVNINRNLFEFMKLSTKGRFKLNIEELKILQENFIADSISGKDALLSITLHHEKLKYIYDPHTATAVSAKDGKGIRLENLVVLATAHPAKFSDVVMKETSIKPELPENLKKTLNQKEKVKILPKDLKEVKDYIMDRV